MAVKIELDDILNVIGERLTELRLENDFYQAEMADIMQTYQESYHLIEKGKRSIKPLELYNLSVSLGVNVGWIMGLSDDKYSPMARIYHRQLLKKKEVDEKAKIDLATRKKRKPGSSTK